MRFTKQIIFFAALITTLLTGCSTVSVTSTRINSPMAMDGKINDWGKTLQYIEDEQIGFGASNDSDFLYICFTTRDWRRAADFLRTGITIFIEPENSSCTSFGMRIKNLNPPTDVDPFKNRDEKIDNKKILDQFIQTAEIEIINKDNQVIDQFPLKNNFKINPGLNFDNSQFVFEIQIPLKQTPSTPYAACTSPQNNVQVGIITGVNDHGRIIPDERKGPGGNMGRPGGGIGNHKEGRGGPGGQRPAKFKLPEPLEFKINVTVSE